MRIKFLIALDLIQQFNPLDISHTIPFGLTNRRNLRYTTQKLKLGIMRLLLRSHNNYSRLNIHKVLNYITIKLLRDNTK